MKLELSVDTASEPISGSLVVPAGEPVAFVGYTALVSALERIRERDRNGQVVDAEGEPA
jgi:hypothetical protein